MTSSSAFRLTGPLDLTVSCARGQVELVRREVEALGYEVAAEHATGLSLTGTLRDAMRLDLHLRCAFRVLVALTELAAPDGEALYRRALELPWEELIPADGYVTVTARVDTFAVNSSMFASLKLKDAIVDRISEATGRRPDSGPRRTGVVIQLSWKGERCWLSLDTAGEKLSDRGYRKRAHKAPMRETLAAACLLSAGYDGQTHLVNPMCGSGTLAIEAALLATGRAPGLLRHDFGFRHVRPFDPVAWKELRAEARAARRPCAARIVASDRDPKAVEVARHNARTAGVEDLIEFAVCDFAETPLPEGGGLVILNPEYGKRLGDREQLQATYRQIGDFFKQRCGGCTGAVFTCDLALAKAVGLRTRRRVTLYNGELEGRLLLYELYAGSKKQRGGEDAP